MSNETQTTQSAIEQENNLANPFSEESWTNSSVKAEEVKSNQSESFTKKESEFDEEIYDADEYLKQQLGFNDWQTAKNEIEELRKRKESGIEFENEESKKFYEYAKEKKEDELLNFLQEKRKIDKLAESDIKDTNIAAEIIKLSMYQKNRELDQAEIDFLFNEKFQMPSKPEQGFDELDSDYEIRVAKWENRVNEVEKKMIIEAKLAKPELEKIKKDLVLPDIYPNNENFNNEFSEAQKVALDSFYGNVESAINSFNGLSVTVNEEGADFSVAYIPNEEEKQAVANQLKFLGEHNLDTNMLFAQRWVNDDGTINVNQMTRDLFLLQNEGKITQKYVNEAANKRLSMYLKKQSNIDLGGTTSQGTYNPNNNQSEMDKLAAIMFAK